MKKIVKHPGFSPAILVSKFKEKGVWYVRVEWTNIPYGEHYRAKRANNEGVFRESDCVITRAKYPWELKVIKFFRKIFKIKPTTNK